MIQTEPQRIGCLIFPLSALAAFIVGSLFSAAIGFSAFTSTILGLVCAGIGILFVWKTLKRDKAGSD
ncbi:MAG: hypothetical protein P8J01_00415 [Acidimicrobiales bacterium]|jgi:hypothetical protein|nr:hypothetical protein [Acidimicrobiales bacterium]MDG1844836.1 hypothetical protein [Acidimicrobiales bacterium]